MPEPTLVIALVAVFASVALLTASVTSFALDRVSLSPVRRRLRGPAKSDGDSLVSDSMLTDTDEKPGAVLRAISAFVPKSPKQMGTLQRRLSIAGLHRRSHATLYSAAEVLAPIIGFTIPAIVAGLPRGIVWALLGGGVGYILPGLLLDRRIAGRQRVIQNGLPDVLDLLIVCLESGLALDHAILKCADELKVAHPILAEELRLINVECRAGKPRIEAFKNFAARTKVDDVRSLVAMLVQTDRFGTSIAQALRTHAEVSRTKRRQRAEEAAAKMGVKLVFPLVFCLFPAFYVVTLGPAVIKFINAFGNGGLAVGGLK